MECLTCTGVDSLGEGSTGGSATSGKDCRGFVCSRASGGRISADIDRLRACLFERADMAVRFGLSAAQHEMKIQAPPTVKKRGQAFRNEQIREK